MKKLLMHAVPWALFALFAAEIVAILVPRADKDFRVQDFGRLPALLTGRMQPLDTVGRNALLQIRNTASVPLVEKKSYEFWKHPPKLKATEWLLEVMTRPEMADTRPIFLISHPDLINDLNLHGKGREKSGLFYFSFAELADSLPQIERQGRQAMRTESQARTAYQRQVAKLFNALNLYRRLKNSLQTEDTRDFAAELTVFENSIGAGIAAVKAREAGQAFDQAAFDRFAGFMGKFDWQARIAYPLLVPSVQKISPTNAAEIAEAKTHAAGKPEVVWQNIGQALFEAGVHNSGIPPAVRWLAQMASAYRQNDAPAFNRALDQYRAWLAEHLKSEVRKGRVEFFYNNLQAFLHAMIIYLCAFVLAAGAMLALSFWPNGAETLRRSAFYLIALAWVVHTGGLLLRMWLERRPPVTNLYSSAVFIGWMSVLLGLILERIYRVGIGAAVAAFIGFITLVIAHNLALGGDTMEVLRAVLDTNFWLATHVVTITLGYAATFVAGFLGIIYVLLGLLTPLLGLRPGNTNAGAVSGNTAIKLSTLDAQATTDLGQALAKMVYGIVCFALLFSFVGTVTGGIWADQAWGRFWGWDPKENGALIIVIWLAIILHARRDGLVRERGLMNMAIFGNVVTAFSWFGVNMLGVGLHSYGFMDAAFKWLVLFVASQLAIIGMGLLPLKLWRSFRASADVRPMARQTNRPF